MYQVQVSYLQYHWSLSPHKTLVGAVVAAARLMRNSPAVTATVCER